jgi:LEA14-like dessication related protein
MIRKLLFIGGLGALTYGVYEYWRTQAIILKRSKVDITKVELLSQTTTETKIRVFIKVINNSEKKLILKSFKFNIFIDDKFIGEVVNSDLNNVILPNGGDTRLSFDYILNQKEVDLLGILGGFISKGMKTTLSLDGKVSAKMGIINVSTPVKIDFTMRDLFL